MASLANLMFFAIIVLSLVLAAGASVGASSLAPVVTDEVEEDYGVAPQFRMGTVPPKPHPAPAPPEVSAVCKRLTGLHDAGIATFHFAYKYCEAKCDFLRGQPGEPLCNEAGQSLGTAFETLQRDSQDEQSRAKKLDVKLPYALGISRKAVEEKTWLEDLWQRVAALKSVLIPVIVIGLQSFVAMVVPGKNSITRWVTFSACVVALMVYRGSYVDVFLFGASLLYITLFDGYKTDRFDRVFTIGLILTSVAIPLSLAIGTLYWSALLTALLFIYYVWSVHIALASRLAGDTTYVALMFISLALYARMTMVLILVEGQNSFFLETFWHVVNWVLPLGHTAWYYQNAYYTAVSLLRLYAYEYQVPNALEWTLATGAASVLLAILVRAMYGIYILKSVKRTTYAEDIMWGFYIYCVDVLGFLRVLTVLSDTSKKQLNITVLSLIAGLGLLFESLYARDFLMVRIILCILDAANITPYGVGKLVMLFRTDVVLQSMSQFRQVGARPFIKLDQLRAIRDSVYKLLSQNKDRSVQGAIFCAMDATGRHHGMTVSHCVIGDSQFIVDGRPVPYRGAVTIGGDPLDPVVSGVVDLGAKLRMEMMSRSDEYAVDHLLVFKYSGSIAAITDFSFAYNEGIIRAAVDLESGDSGSPIIAVLKDGGIRYAGAVSRGNPDQGGGNVLTWIAHTTSDSRRDGSPGAAEGNLPIVNQLKAAWDDYFEDPFEVIAPDAGKRESAEAHKRNRKRAQDRREKRSRIAGLASSLGSSVETHLIGALDRGLGRLVFSGPDATKVAAWVVS